MAEAQFGEIRITLDTGLCIKINNTNGVSYATKSIEPGSFDYIDLVAENNCSTDTQMNLSFLEYYGENLTGISIELADENEQLLSNPYTVPANTTQNLKLKITVDVSVSKNLKFIIRTFFKSVES